MTGMISPWWDDAISSSGVDWDNVVLLMGYAGSDGSTSFVDESQYGRSVSPVGNAQIDTAISKFGGSALLLDGASDCLEASYWTLDKDGAVAGILSGYDVQMEAWIRFAPGADLAGNYTIFSVYRSQFEDRSFRFRYLNGALEFLYSTNGSASTTAVSGAWAPSKQVWYHVAYTRVDGISRVFVDGVKLAESAVNNFESFNTAIPFRIGAASVSGSIATVFNGHIDEARVVVYEGGNGSGKLYEADFTAPTAPFPRS